MEIFLQRQAVFLYIQRMRQTNVAVMPGLIGYAGHVLFHTWVAKYEPVLRGMGAEPSSRGGERKVVPRVVAVRGSKIAGKACFMLTVSRLCKVPSRKALGLVG